MLSLIIKGFFTVVFICDFCIIDKDLSRIGGFEFVCIFVKICHETLFRALMSEKWYVRRREFVVVVWSMLVFLLAFYFISF